MSSMAIWWVRRDMRLRDNYALQAALAGGRDVVPLFILDPNLLASDYTGDKRLDFMRAGLEALDQSLRQLGSRLVIRSGQPERVLERMGEDHDIRGIYAEADYSPYARARDQAVSRSQRLSLVPGLTIRPVDDVRKADGDPYVVYSAYRRRWRSLSPPTAAELIDPPQAISTPGEVASDPLPRVRSAWDFMPSAGEGEALNILRVFADGQGAAIYRYGSRRDMLAQQGTSRLSPYLRFGMLSAKRAFVTGRGASGRAPDDRGKDSARKWVDELLWREFYLSIMFHFPRVRQQSFRREYEAMQWENDEVQFEAWRRGETGFPIVDAGMRQLLATGWMHNRARMIAASFLVKDLLIDWRWGERWFMQNLIDGDPASNNGGWQWIAGTGTDAAPYFRIFNPVLQGEKFDPEGGYIRRWVPELASVPRKFIHSPWRMPEDVQLDSGCLVGADYPERIVDHQWARERAMAAYKDAKG